MAVLNQLRKTGVTEKMSLTSLFNATIGLSEAMCQLAAKQMAEVSPKIIDNDLCMCFVWNLHSNEVVFRRF